MVEIKTDEDAKKCIEDNFEGIQEDFIKVLYRAKRQLSCSFCNHSESYEFTSLQGKPAKRTKKSNDDPETALVETLKIVLISSDGDVARTSFCPFRQPLPKVSVETDKTSATVVAEDATALARSHVEDSFLTDKKNTGEECVFVMKHGRLYYGIIKEYDDKVITMQARSAYAATLIPYPQDILLYRTELSTISCERINDV